MDWNPARGRQVASTARLVTALVIPLIMAAGWLAASAFVAAPPARATSSLSTAGAITVSRTSGLNPAGETITVRGSGFDVSRGIYVAVCVDNGPGALPTPCLGGADTGGSGSGSAWISSNPPPYGTGLATPYGPGGSFAVTLSVAARDPVSGADCTRVSCAVVTRADHTRPDDRSQDTKVPLSFGAPATSKAPRPPATSTPTRTTTPASPSPASTSSTTVSGPSTSTTTITPAIQPAAAESESGGIHPPWWLALAAALLAVAAAIVVVRRRTRAGSPAADPAASQAEE